MAVSVNKSTTHQNMHGSDVPLRSNNILYLPSDNNYQVPEQAHARACTYTHTFNIFTIYIYMKNVIKIKAKI
jgi:hypothetical protein